MSRLVLFGYLVSMVAVLGIVLIYLMHLREFDPMRVGVTTLVALWVSANFILEVAGRIGRRPPGMSSGSDAVSPTE